MVGLSQQITDGPFSPGSQSRQYTSSDFDTRKERLPHPTPNQNQLNIVYSFGMISHIVLELYDIVCER